VFGSGAQAMSAGSGLKFVGKPVVRNGKAKT
jgi:hypothetical protein